MTTQQLIDEFKTFTGVENDDRARQLLQACNNDLQEAVQLHFASDDGGAATNNEPAPAPPVRNHSFEVNSDDDDDIQVLGARARPRQNVAPAAAAPPQPRNAAPIDLDSDIEVLDEEDGGSSGSSRSYRSNRRRNPAPVDEDGVRAPLASVQGRLVDASYRQYYGGPSRSEAHPIFEQYRDLLEPESPARKRRVAHDGAQEGASTSSGPDLSKIFRPPIDIITRKDWSSLRALGRDENRWILVNIQDPSEFASQKLNRDTWSQETIKEFIKANLLFWQTYKENSEGRRVTAYYAIKNFPAVFIVDPRTGENVCTIKNLEPVGLLTELTDFCDRYPTFKAYDDEIRKKYAQISAPSVP